MSSLFIKNFLQSFQIPFIEDAMLRDFTTFKIGGLSPLLILCETSETMERVVSFFRHERERFDVIGQGSNLLVSDSGIPHSVIRYNSTLPEISLAGYELTVTGATRLDDVAAFAAQKGLAGINFASGIPGTIGGAVAGNAGAFGCQIADVVKEVVVLTDTAEKIVMDVRKLEFNYRSSIFKNDTSLILLSARFDLKPGDASRLIKEREEILALRRQKHPDYHVTPCAGSFFKNIIREDGKREAAGWFLEQAGCKDLISGDAAVFQGHANIVINKGNAAALDVLSLTDKMKLRVKEKFGILLQPEVQFLGLD